MHLHGRPVLVLHVLTGPAEILDRKGMDLIGLDFTGRMGISQD